jgi:hypothetical protein
MSAFRMLFNIGQNLNGFYKQAIKLNVNLYVSVCIILL